MNDWKPYIFASECLRWLYALPAGGSFGCGVSLGCSDCFFESSLEALSKYMNSFGNTTFLLTSSLKASMNFESSFFEVFGYLSLHTIKHSRMRVMYRLPNSLLLGKRLAPLSTTFFCGSTYLANLSISWSNWDEAKSDMNVPIFLEVNYLAIIIV